MQSQRQFALQSTDNTNLHGLMEDGKNTQNTPPIQSGVFDQTKRLALVEEILDRQNQLHEVTLDLLDTLAQKRDNIQKLRAYRKFKPQQQRLAGLQPKC